MTAGMHNARVGMTRKEFEAKLVAMAWKDEAFKQRLLNNPKGVFEAELGVRLPEDLDIGVLEETDGRLYLVLPQNPDQGPELELSDEQLELVTGGSGMPVFLLSLLFPPKD